MSYFSVRTSDLPQRIRQDDLVMSRHLLGTGAFGSVYKAELQNPQTFTHTKRSERVTVAVKTLHDSYGPKYRYIYRRTPNSIPTQYEVQLRSRY